MDINMPCMDGLECTKTVTEKYPETRVIALSQFSETRFVKRMIKNGASGYLSKDASKDELVDAIRLVYIGEKYYSKNLRINDLMTHAKKSSRIIGIPNLTKREIEIITLISHEYSTPEIADQLSISYNTVERHRANLLEKSGVKNTAGLVRWALENDLIN